jgi:hypothetical protein
MDDVDGEEDAVEEADPPVAETLEQIKIRAALRDEERKEKDEERKEKLFQAELRRIEAATTQPHTVTPSAAVAQDVEDDYDIIPFPTPPVEWSSHIHDVSDLTRQFLYYGLAPSTRKTYSSYQRSYENFCVGRAIQPYPAGEGILVEWISVRAFGSADEGLGALKADSLARALSAIKSVHIDRRLPLRQYLPYI